MRIIGFCNKLNLKLSLTSNYYYLYLIFDLFFMLKSMWKALKKLYMGFISVVFGIFRRCILLGFNTFNIVFNIYLKIKKYTSCIFSGKEFYLTAFNSA